MRGEGLEASDLKLRARSLTRALPYLSPRCVATWLALSVLFATGSSAHAHLMNTGLGPFYDGLAHLFVTPEDLLPVIALALLGGLLGPRTGRAVLFTLPLAWLGGSLTGGLINASFTLSIFSALLTIAVGVLVAASKPLPVLIIVGLTALLGWLHGSLGGIEQAQTKSLILLATGVATALFVVVSLFAGQVSRLRVPWLRLAVRVGGSWIAAIGLLMLGWLVRGT